MTNRLSWIKGKIKKGGKIGNTIGYPTINIDNPLLMSGYKKGVYGCKVKIKSDIFKGVLFFGPRLVLKEKTDVVEIFIFEFNNNIYGRTVHFSPLFFLRAPKNFKNLADLRMQLKKDCKRALFLLK